MTKKNEDLQRAVLDAIKWEPLLNAAEIGVTAKDGIVTLTGEVDNYAKKAEAEHATKKVKGVKAIVEKIDVNLGSTTQKTDNEIANEVLNTFNWNWAIPSNKLTIKVENGWITLGGELFWHYQRDAAQRAVHNLLGVKGIINNITIKTETAADVEEQEITSAIKRNLSMYDCDIQVKVEGNKVALKGVVDSLYQKEEAGRIAWNTLGVWQVDNSLVVEHNH